MALSSRLAEMFDAKRLLSLVRMLWASELFCRELPQRLGMFVQKFSELSEYFLTFGVGRPKGLRTQLADALLQEYRRRHDASMLSHHSQRPYRMRRKL